ncbi:arylamine N-acetyltransferase family protein [Pseudodonghicola flavimaris]|uniref:Arylamine N-acetyltransferase n=1 Tax=Pseudodonghicola flavimaris TaxID=3050036 RepID=A0ABT7EX80_9RHOB|nr:arylamine N-acetyltransferase [Pseudodonghicola flavimaris]MDK3016947.1 arylamine N-acetyltransferase [Pseudodonghicola flavimaris]
MSGFDLSAYLDRLGLTPVPVTAAGLRDLQRAQLRSLPFDSITPYLGGTPDLDLAAIMQKIVHGRRGGYCFELNALLGAALQALRFPLRRSLARVRKGASTGGPRSHLMLQVTLEDGLYLADAGYGGPGPLTPLRIDSDAPQQAPNGRYRFWDDPISGERVLDKWTGTAWFPLYGFDDAHVGDMDIAGANHICATWSAMPFAANLMLAGFDGDTRIGVFNRALTRESPEGLEKSEIADIATFAALLTGELGLRLSDEELDRLWDKLTAVP